ncbi:hypothetical protein [Alcanivorax sp. 1008]|uniref:hypothetical protein n=1 Tax=Alcanivorax sp. 1008 TaxID=2816853 RepID=UPI001DEB74F6|nr:hypothetical protein [Alcanivorax sp. 1008]MCC1497679.1 hypothetical protein [Alcanivorax sp. 1008]
MPLRQIALIVLLAFTAGCASTTTLVTRHSAESIEAPVSKLLLIGRAADLDMRQQWEQACATQLKHNGLRLRSSHSLWPGQLPESEALMQEALSQGFDGVMIGEITSLLLLPLQMPAGNVVTDERRPSSDASQRSPGFQITLTGKEPASDPVGPQDIEFQLQRPSGKVLWNGLLRTNEANQIEAIARSQCKRLHKTLSKSGLLP